MRPKNTDPQIKPTVAMIAMGVMGAGLQGQGIPVIGEMINHVAKEFNVTYYSFQPVDRSKIPSSLTVRQIVSWHIPGRLKYLLLMLRLVADHFKHPHQLFYSIGTLPTGQWAVLLGRIFK